MINIEDQLDVIATEFLENDEKPNFTNRTFLNSMIIFQNTLLDKMYDNQSYIEMNMEERMDMAFSCGNEFRQLILKYTGMDTHNIDEFLK